MSYKKSIENVTTDALKFVRKDHVIGLGSGRAAAALVKELGNVTGPDLRIRGVPTSLQIREIAQEVGIDLVEPGMVSHIDITFDGADQIDCDGYMVKGGGGALLRENILASMSDMVIIMADETKFVNKLCMPIPVEIHPAARSSISLLLENVDIHSKIRVLDRGYPMFTENGNIILDCDFGTVDNPSAVGADIRQLPGVLEVGIFNKPDILYKMQQDGCFEILYP